MFFNHGSTYLMTELLQNSCYEIITSCRVHFPGLARDRPVLGTKRCAVHTLPRDLLAKGQIFSFDRPEIPTDIFMK